MIDEDTIGVFCWLDDFNWACKCGSKGRKKFTNEFEAERAYERHLQRCSVNVDYVKQ